MGILMLNAESPTNNLSENSNLPKNSILIENSSYPNTVEDATEIKKEAGNAQVIQINGNKISKRF